MKFVFFVFIVFSIFSTSVLLAQDTGVAVAQKPVVAKAAKNDEPPKGYMYGPGDEITGRVAFEPEYNFVAVVDENGRIEVPFSNVPILAQCKTENQLRAELKDLLEIYLKNPQFSTQTKKGLRAQAAIHGAVINAARIELTRRATLMELIVAAGGVSELAGGLVQVFRIQQPTCTADDDPNRWKPDSGDASEIPSRIYSISAVNSGREETNPVILPGDIIHVMKAPPAYVTGEVINPQAILLKENGTTLMDAMGMISGPTQTAKTKEIKIFRLKPGTSPSSKDRETLVANLDLIRTGKQKDILLQPYDIIQVDKAKKPLALTILEFAIGAGRQAIQSAANTGGARIVY